MAVPHTYCCTRDSLVSLLIAELPTELVFGIIEYLPVNKRERLDRRLWRGRKVVELVLESDCVPVKEQVQICLHRWLTYVPVASRIVTGNRMKRCDFSSRRLSAVNIADLRRFQMQWSKEVFGSGILT